MSQQRPARKLPSPLMDPAEETMRRRCRDPINVESLLVSPADGLGPERRGPWRRVGRAGPVRSDRVASQAQPPLPFQGEAGLSVFGVGSPPGLGCGRSSVSSALALPVTDCEPNPPFPSTHFVQHGLFKCVVSPPGFYVAATGHRWRKLLNFTLENLVFLPPLTVSILCKLSFFPSASFPVFLLNAPIHSLVHASHFPPHSSPFSKLSRPV